MLTKPDPRGRRATTSCRAACTPASSTRCRSRRRSTRQLLMVAGLRPLLPDRALLPRRGPARRPAAGVHRRSTSRRRSSSEEDVSCGSPRD
jgi:hypothetical protein